MVNWSASKKRALMKRRGTEDAKEEPSFMQPLLKRQERPRGPSKAQLRAEADAAYAEWIARKAAERGSETK